MIKADEFKAAIPMSAALKSAIPDANYVIAVKLPANGTGNGNAEVTVHVKDLNIIKTDLRAGPAATGGEVLVPAADQFLVLITPDDRVSYCTGTPRWKWI